MGGEGVDAAERSYAHAPTGGPEMARPPGTVHTSVSGDEDSPGMAAKVKELAARLAAMELSALEREESITRMGGRLAVMRTALTKICELTMMAGDMPYTMTQLYTLASTALDPTADRAAAKRRGMTFHLANSGGSGEGCVGMGDSDKATRLREHAEKTFSDRAGGERHHD